MAFWLRNGGEQTVRSYGGAEGVPAEHRTWMEGLPLVARDDHRAFVHAGFMPGVPLAQQDERACLWIRERFLTTDYDFGAHVVHGHTNQHEEKIETSEPELLPNRTNLDTGACYTGILTIGVFDQSQARPLRVLTVGEREE
ncbi:MAG: hypothetical protein A3E78_09520 [Alphaproteobacteria bacterium RIFCSPHIGHO2_12_FULL_63_12]|nr:MAG: hypothetical protein A3E78_09520 [Alphaproteobacteria bacterium RIFCSPHIGHO2_12_FULL_63_12]